MSERIAVLMSGGVDSTLAACLLQQQGYAVEGLTMVFAPPVPAESQPHCSTDEAAAAAAEAARLGLAHHIIDTSEAFARDVIEPFRAAYRTGRTPIPCVPCNARIKFGLLLEHARTLGCSRVATGHYLRCHTTDNEVHVRRGVDPGKDQSYFLCRVPAQALSCACFPLGELTKQQVRQQAAERGLAVADKPESQEICFAGNDYRTIVNLPPREGVIEHVEGEILGKQPGFWNYTIGQRRGLRIAWAEPLYVIALDPAANRVIVGEEPYLYSDEVLGLTPNLLAPLQPGDPVTAKIRHQHKPAPGIVAALDEDRVRVVFDTPQRAITPGQALALYQDDRLVAGAEIAPL